MFTTMKGKYTNVKYAIESFRMNLDLDHILISIILVEKDLQNATLVENVSILHHN